MDKRGEKGAGDSGDEDDTGPDAQNSRGGRYRRAGQASIKVFAAALQAGLRPGGPHHGRWNSFRTIIGSYEGSKPRQVPTRQQWIEMMMRSRRRI